MHEWDDNNTLLERTQRFFHRAFPERQIHIRTHGHIRFFRIPRWTQASVTATALLFTGWVGYATFNFIQHDKIIGAKNTQIADAQHAYNDLLSDVNSYQSRFTELTRDLKDNHDLTLSLVERNATLQISLTTVEKRLRNTEDEREDVASARETLRRKLTGIENDMLQLSTKNFSLRNNLMSVETDLQTVVRDRDNTHQQNTILQTQIAALEDRLTSLQTAQDITVEKMTEGAMAYIGSLEKIVEIAGIEIDTLIASSQGIVIKESQGGPFIPVKPEEAGGVLMKKLVRLDDHLNQWETLQTIMARLPLAAPLNTYSITSSFGKRRDPMNKRWSAHYGVDFGAPMRSPIYAPAPGVVTQAGNKGRYGRFIEIDHGSGIFTRYGHLNKIYVKRGQKIDFRHKIGQLGSSGRSTGPHLHYEVVFNGKPRNPMLFIKAGRHVFQK